MKQLAFIVFICCSYISFGQSAKKLNKQLQAELLLAEKEQDSVYQLFFKEREILEKRRSVLDNKIRDIHSGEQVSRQIGKSISKSIFTLSQLEITTKDVFPGGFDANAFSGAGSFIKEYEDALHKTVFFRFVSLEPFFLKEEKLNERNILLQDMTGEYRVALKENESAFLDLRVYMRQLGELEPRLDSLADQCKTWISELESKAAILTQRVKDAREDYRLNGPEGFLSTYREQFPAIHPLSGISNADGPYDGYEEEPLTLSEDPAPKVLMVTDEPAQYPDGRAAMMAYLEYNLVYPASAKDKNISGKVFLRFVVSETGEIFQIEVMKGIEGCPECNKEAMRVIKAMPRWIPGKEKGKPVNSYFNLPVPFKQ